MRYFYSLMLWCCEFELAVARATGRSRQDITRLTDDAERWRQWLHREQINGRTK